MFKGKPKRPEKSQKQVGHVHKPIFLNNKIQHPKKHKEADLQHQNAKKRLQLQWQFHGSITKPIDSKELRSTTEYGDRKSANKIINSHGPWVKATIFINLAQKSSVPTRPRNNHNGPNIQNPMIQTIFQVNLIHKLPKRKERFEKKKNGERRIEYVDETYPKKKKRLREWMGFRSQRGEQAHGVYWISSTRSPWQSEGGEEVSWLFPKLFSALFSVSTGRSALRCHMKFQRGIYGRRYALLAPG